MNNVELITVTTYIFFVYMVLALFIERFMEMLVATFGYLEYRFKWQSLWNGIAKKYQRRLDKLYSSQGEANDITKKLFDAVLWRVIMEKPYEGGKRIISADLVRINYLRIWTQMGALVISIIFVGLLNLDLVKIIEKILPEAKKFAFITDFKFLRLLFTAIAISVGVDPLHQLIRQIEKRAQAKAKPVQEGGIK